MKKSGSILVWLSILTLCCSCNGIFSGIYDDPQTATGDDYGFISIDQSNNSGTIYIDATNYMQWTYIDFNKKSIEVKTIDTTNVNNNDIADAGIEEPQNWDFAVHRYDVKTNNGAAKATQFATLDELRNSATRPDGSDFTADIIGKVTVDMSNMMDGNIKYISSPINKVLSQWLDVNTSEMPPIYTLSKQVYFLHLANGEYAALLFSNYMNEKSVKGYITIDYIYPF